MSKNILFQVFGDMVIPISNYRKQRAFDEKKKIYHMLLEVLHGDEKFIAQSEYLEGYGGNGDAEYKIKILDIQLHDAIYRCELANDDIRKQDLSHEINKIQGIQQQHYSYIGLREQLFNELKSFDENCSHLLDIYGSKYVRFLYYDLKACLKNEYKFNRGISTEQILCVVRGIRNSIRRELNAR